MRQANDSIIKGLKFKCGGLHDKLATHCVLTNSVHGIPGFLATFQ